MVINRFYGDVPESERQSFQNFRRDHPLHHADFGGVQFPYRRLGAPGDAVLLLVGELGFSDCAWRLAQGLSDSGPVVMCDWPANSSSLDDVACGLHAILAAEELPSAHVVSFGAASELARRFVRAFSAESGHLILLGAALNEADGIAGLRRMHRASRTLPWLVTRSLVAGRHQVIVDGLASPERAFASAWLAESRSRLDWTSLCNLSGCLVSGLEAQSTSADDAPEWHGETLHIVEAGPFDGSMKTGQNCADIRAYLASIAPVVQVPSRQTYEAGLPLRSPTSPDALHRETLWGCDLCTMGGILDVIRSDQALRSPHSVRIREITSDTPPQIVSDLPAGTPLVQVLESGPLDPVAAVDVVAQVVMLQRERMELDRLSSALGEPTLPLMHVSPAQVYVERRGTISHFVRVVQPWTSNLRHDDLCSSDLLPTFSATLAPEVLMGKPETEASAVFSTALLLFVCLSGVDTWDADDWMRSVWRRGAQPHPTLEDVGATAPKRVARVLRQGLRLAPEERPQTLMRFLRLLETAAKRDGLVTLLSMIGP